MTTNTPSPRAKRARPANYDSACYDLAEHFLSDTPEADEEMRTKLAAHIQQAVESWFSEDQSS
jgi:hypothetical protein